MPNVNKHFDPIAKGPKQKVFHYSTGKTIDPSHLVAVESN